MGKPLLQMDQCPSWPDRPCDGQSGGRWLRKLTCLAAPPAAISIRNPQSHQELAALASLSDRASESCGCNSFATDAVAATPRGFAHVRQPAAASGTPRRCRWPSAASGVGDGLCTSWLPYRGLVIIRLHRLFTVRTAVIALLAASMAGQAAAVLRSADLLPGQGEQLWNTSLILVEDSVLGRSLHALG